MQPDGTNMQLVETLGGFWRGRLLRVKIGAWTDGLSGKCFKTLLTNSKTFYECVFHDGGYKDQLEESKDFGQTWAKVTLCKEECDAMLYELLIEGGCESAVAEAIYLAVKEFGGSAFDEDRKEKP